MNFSILNKVSFSCKSNNLLLLACYLFLQSNAQSPLSVKEYSSVITGAQQFDNYLPLLKNKRVGVITNATGMVGNSSLVDTLLKLKVNIKKIFGPEHGFRGNVEAGERVQNGRDIRTGLPVISLYGKNKKPTKEQLKDLDVLIYDIQDVGVRFYTYISTLAYAMEACAESGKDLIVLDRPNPNGFYIDGPVLRQEYISFLGLHPVPLVYGLTVGEYAKMVNGEGWLKNKVKCKLKVIALKNYDRNSAYALPYKPSPNLPNLNAILLYPSLGLFEGSIISVGRGTEFPFQVTGHPDYPVKTFSYMPLAGPVSSEPKFVNRICYGLDLRKSEYLQSHPRKICLDWLILLYGEMKRDDFFDANFDYHAGNKHLRHQVVSGTKEQLIRESWEPELSKYKEMRKKYLLYPDTETGN